MDKLTSAQQATVRKLTNERLIKALVKAGALSQETAQSLGRDKLLDAYAAWYSETKTEMESVEKVEKEETPLSIERERTAQISIQLELAKVQAEQRQQELEVQLQTLRLQLEDREKERAAAMEETYEVDAGEV